MVSYTNFPYFVLKRERKALYLDKEIKAHEEGYTEGPRRRRKDKRPIKECKEKEKNQHGRAWDH